jgi:hypothetical protein
MLCEVKYIVPYDYTFLDDESEEIFFTFKRLCVMQGPHFLSVDSKNEAFV